MKKIIALLLLLCVLTGCRHSNPVAGGDTTDINQTYPTSLRGDPLPERME